MTTIASALQIGKFYQMVCKSGQAIHMGKLIDRQTDNLVFDQKTIPVNPTDVFVETTLAKKLEDDQVAVCGEAMTKTPSGAMDTLMSFMRKGSEQFEKENGRKMTYAEMRQIWG